MRELKFRAWNTKIKDYLLWFHLSNNGEIESSNLSGVYDGWEKDCTLEQYTGLTDKNGKEIYEGDLIKTKAGDILQVNSLTHSGWFATGIKSHNGIQLWLLTIDDCIEIIGNIHENPELLGGEE